MAYVSPNFKTKKALEAAIADGLNVSVFSVGEWPANQNGFEHVEGPHYPQPHRWWARVAVENGAVVGMAK